MFVPSTNPLFQYQPVLSKVSAAYSCVLSFKPGLKTNNVKDKIVYIKTGLKYWAKKSSRSIFTTRRSVKTTTGNSHLAYQFKTTTNGEPLSHKISFKKVGPKSWAQDGSMKGSTSYAPVSNGKDRVTNVAETGCRNSRQNRKCIKVCLWNAQSLKRKIDIVKDFRLEHELDLFLFTESWLKSDDLMEIGELEDDDCFLLHTPREGRPGGGVAGLIQSKFRATKATIKKADTFEHMEINLHIGSRNITLVIVYRPEPSNKNMYAMSEFFDEFTELLSGYQHTRHEIVIVGDFNFHMNKSDDPRTIKFNAILEMFDLVQHVAAPTHKGGNTLDLVITPKDSSLLSNCTVSDLNSDHNCILFDLNIQNSGGNNTKRVAFRKTRNIDKEKFKLDIKNKFSVLNLETESEVSLERVVELYNSTSEVLDKHAPKTEKHVTIRQPTPWVNEDIKKLKTEKRRAEKRWRKSRQSVDWDIFKSKRNTMNATLTSLKHTSLAAKINETKGDSKAMFKVLNASLHRKQELPLPHHTNHKKLADEFNSFFDDKIQGIRNKLISTLGPSNNNSSEGQRTENVTPLSNFKPLSSDEIKKLVLSMPTKHCGLDPIPTWLMKDSINQFLPVLTKIVNLSLQQGKMPDKLKHAIVKPLLKKLGLELVKKNYRPVSNLPFLGKLIESAVIQQYTEHLTKNKLNDPKQSAYKKFHSTETLLLKIHDCVMKNMAKGEITMLVLLDLSAAFDTIDHNILLNRLEKRCKVEGTALSWFKSYLSDRSQSVIIKDKLSDSIRLCQGVPQGSKLGPILFNSYIAPLSGIAESNAIEDEKYADDEQLILSFHPSQAGSQISARKRMEKCINEIRDFLHNNMLCNNSDKTEFLIIGTPNTLKSLQMDYITIENIKIKPVDDVRNLGVIFDKHMTMEKQVNKMCRNAYFNLRNISKIRKCLDNETTKTAVHALVTPHLDYGNALLYGIANRLENKLTLAQNAAARLITRVKKSEPISHHKMNLHWLPIPARIEFKILTTAWKAQHDQAPAYICELLQKKNNEDVNLRSNDQLLLKQPEPIARGKTEDRALSRAGPKLWNLLPPNIRNINTLECFKSKLKTHLFKKYYKT